MRIVQASELRRSLSRLLDEIERGEIYVVTRRGKAVARLVPETQSRTDARSAVERIKAFRRTMPAISSTEILSARDSGRR